MDESEEIHPCAFTFFAIPSSFRLPSHFSVVLMFHSFPCRLCISSAICLHGCLDYDFFIPSEPEHVKSLDVALQTIPGVLETGIFCGMAERAIIGDAEGQTTEIAAKNAVKAQNTELFGKQEFLATKK